MKYRASLMAAAVVAIVVAPLLLRSTLLTGSRAKNVIVILVDTLRADHLSGYGYQRATSPNIDRFLKDSIVFEEARSQASCTFPSLNSLLTSQDPMLFVERAMPHLSQDPTQEPGIYELWQQARAPERFGIPRDILSLPQMLKRRGYFTIAVSASPIFRNRPSQEATNRWGGFGAGFDIFHEECLRKDADCVNNAAFELLDSKSNEPIFLFLHYLDPHDPYSPPDHFERRFGTSYSGSLGPIAAGNPHPLRRALRGDSNVDLDPASVTKEDIRHLVDLYDSEIAYFDSRFAELLAGLKERGLTQNALIALGSDHGESFLEHGNLVHCNGVYEPEVKVPLVLHIPDGPSGIRVSIPVQNLDLAPTILDYVGALSGDLKLQGNSLLKLMRHGSGYGGRFIFSAQRHQRSIVDRKHKLIYDLLTGDFQLYNLANDPGEAVNTFSREDRISRNLAAALIHYMNEVESGTSLRSAWNSGEELEEQLDALGYFQ